MTDRPWPNDWLTAPEDSTFVYALGPGGTNRFIAAVQAAGPERVTHSEKVAIARLIAAAPDMYEALQAVCDEAGHLAGLSPRTEQQVIAAMKKARGEHD